jgi:uracil-DNA glycosylase family 4
VEDATQQLEALAARVRACLRCDALVPCRARALPGAGHPHTSVMIVAWCPDVRDEAADGAPGDALVEELGAFFPALTGPARESLYVTGLIKCVPRTGCEVRDPAPEEQDNCFEYLSRELSITTPHWILPVGEQTSRYLLRRLFRTPPHGPGETLELRVFDNPAFKVVPVATPAELEERPARERKRYRDRLRSLGQHMGLGV